MPEKKIQQDNSAQVLLEKAMELDHSPYKTSLLEAAVTIADSANDEQLAFQTRMELIKAAIFSGLPDKAIVAYAWCLAMADRQPEKHDWHKILWRYKWIVGNLPDFFTIPRKQIEDMLEDMRIRFRSYGQNEHPYNQIRTTVFCSMGEMLEAQKSMKKCKALAADTLSNCQACWVDEKVKIFIARNQHVQAISEAQPILQGKLSCSCVPECTIGRLLLSFVFQGDAEEAQRLHKANYRRISHKLHHLFAIAHHLTYIAFVGNLNQALLVFQSEIGQSLELATPDIRHSFFVASLFCFQRLKRTGKKKLRLRLPKAFPLYHPKGYYETELLVKWFQDQASELAASFDLRNGNDFYSRQINDLAKLHKKADKFAAKDMTSKPS